MRRAAWLWLGLVLVAALSSMCGSSRPSSYSGGYRDGYNTVRAGASYSAGGGNVLMDTFTIVFTTQDVLTDDNNPASIDTSLVINTFASRTAADSDRRLAFQTALASADSVHRLGASYKVANFAYTYIDTADTSGYRYGSGYNGSFKSSRNVSSAPTKLNRNFPTGDRRAELVYIPFEKYIRSGATIVEAYINRAAIPTGTATTTADTFFVSQISRASDNKWYTTKGSLTGLTDYARASWNRQVSSNAGSLGWGSVNAFPWNPPLAARLKFRSWGAVMDSSATPNNLVINQGFNTSIAAPVQSVVSGAQNNGMIINYALNKSYAEQLHCYLWNDQSNASGRTPYVVVRYTRRIYSGQADVTAPSPPTALLAYGLDGMSVLTWTPSVSADKALVNVYRYFDGAAAVKIGESGSESYIDTSAVNGSPHNYYITVNDMSGNESEASEHVRVVPGDIETLTRPAYAALWYQNIPTATALTSAQLDSLAAFDALVTWSYPFSTGAQNEASMDGLLSNLRSRNPNIALLTYINVITPDVSWEDYPAGSPQKKHWDYCVNADADSAGFGRNLAGGVVESDRYPTLFSNVMYPDLADTLAKFWVEAFDATDSDGELAGFFVDVSDSTLAAHLCYANGCRTKMDFNQDSVPYTSDDDEKAAFQQFHIDFFTALRREFAERNMPSRLLVANTTFGRKLPAAQTANDSLFLSLLDGVLVEGFNKYWPDNDADAGQWDIAAAQQDLLVHAQTAPPLMLWHAIADSSALYMSEVPALAFDGFAMAVNGMDANGINSIPRLPRRLPVPGAPGQYDIDLGGSDPDTLTVPWFNYTARMLTSRNAGAAADTYAVWPYVIYDGPDTLSQSVFWESAGDIGAPLPDLQYHTTVGDREIAVRILPSALSDNTTWLPRDFSHFRIVRESKPASVVIRDTFIVAADTLAIMSEEPESYLWMSTGLTNGVEYKHKIVSVDVLGNASAEKFFADQNRTPVDVTAPASPQDLVSAGGDGYVDLDWAYPTQPADFLRFRIWRRQHDDGGAFALHDSVTISAHQDSVAVSGVEYDYYVVAVDDDGNASAPSDTVTGAWFGTVPVTYAPPSQVRAIKDYTPRTTAVVIYPPSDQTGLTGYTVYRGPWNIVAAPDTTVCIRRFTGLTPDGFGGAVYLDAQNVSVDPDSAFQYTAVALYSGHASDKYAVPATAFSTGGFAFSTPTCAAYGTGSNIGVAVVTVAGADSTRIYRGTSVGSQTFLAGVAAANNPFTDSTAAANTDYYYKVRQYDNETATWTQYSAVSGPVRWTSVPSGAPAISGVTGSVSHGSTIAIAGANFGANSTASIYWDDVESGSFAGFWTDSNGSPNGKIVASASGSGRRHAGSAYHAVADFGSGGGYGSLEYSGTSHTWFCQYWVKLDSNWNWGGAANTPLSNVKFWRMYQTTGNEDFVVALNTFNGSVIIVNENISGFQNTWYHWGNYATEFTENVWHCWQFEYRNSSAAGVADGVFRWWRNGTLAYERTNMVTMEDYSSARYPLIMGFYDSSGASGYDGANTVYFDDFYMSKSLARVEIGNASTYAACSQREIQIPSAWSATSITCTVNAGTLTGSGKYLFVINADGTASAGYPVTIE